MSSQKIPYPLPQGLNDFEKALLEHVLSGDSVVDWSRLFFQKHSQNTTDELHERIHQLLKVNEFDFTRPKDQERLLGIHSESVDYLVHHLHLQLSPHVRELQEAAQIVTLFDMASGPVGSELQTQACALLKTMNAIHHIDGRELLYNCPISLRDLFSLVEDKTERYLSQLLRQEPGRFRYEEGRKAKESLITKLLSRRESIAAQINDRVRYRIVTRHAEDLSWILINLFTHLLPFNFVIPGNSSNQLLQTHVKTNPSSNNPQARIDYTSKDYRVCKFVVDIPVRLDNFLAQSSAGAYRDTLGNIAFVMVEFQIVDEETARQNNEGDSSHTEYKTRQKTGVMKRLLDSN